MERVIRVLGSTMCFTVLPPSWPVDRGTTLYRELGGKKFSEIISYQKENSWITSYEDVLYESVCLHGQQ